MGGGVWSIHLPPSGCPSEDSWPTKAQRFAAWIAPFLRCLREFRFEQLGGSQLHQELDRCTRAWEALRTTTRLARVMPKASRECLKLGITPLVGVLTDIVSYYLRQDPSCLRHPLAFLRATFKTLARAVGPQFFDSTIKKLFQLFPPEQLAELALSQNAAKQEAARTFLLLFKTVLKEGGPKYVPFVRPIFSICLQKVYPRLARADGGVDARRALFDTLYVGYLNHLQYDLEAHGELAHRMFAAFVTAFEHSDITTFKHNLRLLQMLDEKTRALHNARALPEELRLQLLLSLFSALFGKAHDLLRHDIVSLCYELARQDWASFRDRVLLVLCRRCHADPSLVGAELCSDLPSFRIAIDRVLSVAGIS